MPFALYGIPEFFSSTTVFCGVLYLSFIYVTHPQTYKRTLRFTQNHREKNLLRLSKLASVSAGNCSPAFFLLPWLQLFNSKVAHAPPPPHTHTHKTHGVKAVEFLKLHKGNSQHTLLMNSSK